MASVWTKDRAAYNNVHVALMTFLRVLDKNHPFLHDPEDPLNEFSAFMGYAHRLMENVEETYRGGQA